MTHLHHGQHQQHTWYPPPGWEQLVAKHLLRQADLPLDRVRLSDGRVLVVGADAIGEGDNEGIAP